MLGALSNAIAVAIQQATISRARDSGTTSVTVTANYGSSSQQSSGCPFSHLPATSGPSAEERGSG